MELQFFWRCIHRKCMYGDGDIHGMMPVHVMNELGASTFKLAMTSRPSRRHRLWCLWFSCLVRSGAFGFGSTTLDLPNYFLERIESMSDVFYCILMGSKLRAWVQTLTYCLSIKGFTLAVVGNKNPFLPYKLFFNNIGKNGMTLTKSDTAACQICFFLQLWQMEQLKLDERFHRWFETLVQIFIA